jgi:hypothetical protein
MDNQEPMTRDDVLQLLSDLLYKVRGYSIKTNNGDDYINVIDLDELQSAIYKIMYNR